MPSDRELLRPWLGKPANFQVNSGVRERLYSVSADLGFIKPTADPLWPFEFVLVTPFTSAPIDGGETGSFDKSPYEFSEALKVLIRNRVAAGANKELIESLREFAIL